MARNNEHCCWRKLIISFLYCFSDAPYFSLPMEYTSLNMSQSTRTNFQWHGELANEAFRVPLTSQKSIICPKPVSTEWFKLILAFYFLFISLCGNIRIYHFVTDTYWVTKKWLKILLFSPFGSEICDMHNLWNYKNIFAFSFFCGKRLIFCNFLSFFNYLLLCEFFPLTHKSSFKRYFCV